MASNAPAAGAPQTPPPPERVRNFLGWAFAISIGLHLIFGPFLGQYKPYTNRDKEVEKVSVTKKIKVIVPTPPPPTPTPPPATPPPKSTPPPRTTNPPPPKLKVDVPKTHNAKSGQTSEQTYVPPQKGSEEGNPNGVDTSKGSGNAPGTPGPPPPPSPSPKPACAQPHVDATVTRPVEPDYPELAKQQSLTGVTQVKVTLSETGAVQGTDVYKSSGSSLLDRAAIAAAKQSSYSPEIDNCVKQAGSYIFRAEFTSQ
ncbi:MAG TPA: energy transducer TonB [Candidatus Baltobacteraceae bacterium]|nr:energy transducer TonB [Candidatus Baltobacteraceae bacterium]